MAQANCTRSVGRELIQGNWKEAVRLLMSGHEGERADSAAARQLFLEDGDIAGALKQMPRHLTVERAILEASPFPLFVLHLLALCRIVSRCLSGLRYAVQGYTTFVSPATCSICRSIEV